MYRDREKKFEDLVGKTLTGITVTKEEIVFETDEGSRYRLFHSQDCCESVEVEDVNGEWQDLIGSPILFAEESTSGENPAGVSRENEDSFTWTFYRIGTIKGTVVVRWYGESNGYYSELVDFELCKGDQ